MYYDDLRQLFMAHEYTPSGGGYRCTCGWTGSSQAEHMADVTFELAAG